MCVGADIEGSQTNSKHQMKCFVFMFQPSETDAVMLTAMTYFEFQQLTSLWRFLKNKSHSLNSAKLEHCDTWRKFSLGTSAVPYCSTVTFCSGWLPSHGHLNPSLPLTDLVLFTICCRNIPVTVSRVGEAKGGWHTDFSHSS